MKKVLLIAGFLFSIDSYSIEDLPICKGMTSAYWDSSCKARLGNGHYYSGDWYEGKKHGYGVEIWGKDKYSGEYQNGYRHGEGTLSSDEDGFRYEGQWKSGSITGYGVTKWGDGDRYEGDHEDGYMHGQGTFHGSDYKYVGDFKKSKRDGYGTYYYENGDIYQGPFVNHQEHGKGICQLSDKTMREMERGEWRRPPQLAEGQNIFECEYRKGKLKYSRGAGSWLSEFAAAFVGGLVEGAVEAAILGTFTEPCVPEVKSKTSDVIPGAPQYGTKTKTTVKPCATPYKFK